MNVYKELLFISEIQTSKPNFEKSLFKWLEAQTNEAKCYI